ncbi:MAG: hypothetical protein AMS27_02745 [Bacteroides sp. SM23_62_1]|nr:MAG: hypothetical protein AMS27_02745 [Bacteroides sp. SM23_62_1]
MIQFRLLSLAGFLVVILTGSVIIEAQTSNDSVTSSSSINIGLVIPDPDAKAARHGAELAIREANMEGAYGGSPFNLIVHSSEGPWGTGSKVSVSMVFDDDVVAIMGSLDGRNAHLVEQVATKTRVVFLSAWSTDMSLSYAFVPWYFRCLPDDDQQAMALIQEIYKKRKITSVAIIGTEEYDSRIAVNSFIKTADSMKISAPRQIIYRSFADDSQKVLEEIDQYDVEAIILFGKPSLASEIIPLIKRQYKNLSIFGSISLMDDQKASDPRWSTLEGIILVSSGYWFTQQGIAFQEAFQDTYGYQPGPAAAYAYDGTSLIIEAINKYGPDRNKIIDGLAEMNYKTGITGEIRFDKYGNRVGIPGLMTIKNGKPLLIIADE